MANKTIDRKKAIAAGSQSARVGAKSASSRATSSATREEEQSSLKAGSVELLEESDEMAENEEVGEEDEAEAEESDSEAEEEEAEEEAEEEEESRALEKVEDRRVAKRERRDRNVPAVHPQDYATTSTKSGGSRLPDNALVRFARSSYRELRMVTWPTRQETWSWSLVVVGVSAFVAILLGAADLGLSKFVEWWISLAH